MQLLELLAWFGTSELDHFSNIVQSAAGVPEIVDVNDVRFRLTRHVSSSAPLPPLTN